MKNKSLIFLVLLLIGVSLSGCATSKFPAKQHKGMASLPQLNEGSTWDIYWGEDKDGLFTEFIDNIAESSVIIVGEQTMTMPDITVSPGFRTMQKAILRLRPDGEIIEMYNSGLVETSK